MTFVIYSSTTEAIITTKKKEKEAIKRFFDDEKMCRDIDEYDREEGEDIAICLSSCLVMEW